MSQYATPRILLVIVLTVVALANGNCMKRIREIEDKNTGGRLLMGGYTRIENPDKDDIVKDIVAQGVQTYNQRSNGLLQFQDHRIHVAYTQLVNGLNFCVKFQVTSNGCKNNISSDFCRKKEDYECVVSAYKPFKEKTATMDHSSLLCDQI